MASERPEQPEPDVVGQIILLRPDQIDASDRLRPIDPIWAEALGGIMQAEGQRTPIEVCRLPGRADYKLVTGGHRHAGAKMRGIWLRAELVDNDAAERRLRQVSENLHRRDLDPMDRAANIAELVALQKARAGIDPDHDGRSISAQARWQKRVAAEADDATETISVAYGWAEHVADEIGMTSRTVRNDLMLVRRIPPSLVERLRAARHPALRNASQLKALARLDDTRQRRAVDMLVAGSAKSMTEAIAALDHRPKKSAEDRRLSAFIGTFSRMALAEKRGALDALADLLPSGITLEGLSP